MSSETAIKETYELFTHHERNLNLLSDLENKINRRNTLKSLHSQFLDLKARIHDGSAGDGNYKGIFREGLDLYVKILINLISDPVEKTRELSYELLRFYVEDSSVSKEHLNNSILPNLIPIMVQRLGQPELNEPSEEVRILEVQLLDSILQKMETKIAPYVDDYQQIMSSTITDPFHKLRILSCELTIRLAHFTKDVFHYNSERLILPLCKASGHQQWRVRMAVVECIGVVLLIGNYKSMESVLPSITQRLFDASQHVRRTVIQVVGSWMLDYIDRYSYFHKLLPIMLIGLVDTESDEIVKISTELWDKIGKKWLDENINEWKDQADFEESPDEIGAHYPPDLKRPNLGCRLLTWQNAIRILPAIGNEVMDWQLSTRIKSAQLLYTIIWNSESRMTMHVEKILHFMFKACLDEEAAVVKYIHKSAQLLGYFVPLSASWPILSSSLVAYHGSEGPLSVLSSILTGTQSSDLAPFGMEIINLLADDDICQTTKPRHQVKILECCDILMDRVPGIISNGGMEPMFRILITIYAMSENSLARVSLERLSKLGELECLDDLIGQEAGKVLEKVKTTCSAWTPLSPDKLSFDAIFSFGGKGVENNMDTILEIMSSSLSPDKDPDVRLKFFTMLAQQLEYNYGRVSPKQKEKLQDFVKHIVEAVLNPNLVWVAGKTAAALRTASASCLLAILNGQILNPEILGGELGVKIVNSMIGLVDDPSEITRLIVCQSLGRVVRDSEPKLKPEVLHKIYPVMLKKLDDVSDRVRTEACCTIGKIFTVGLPPDYDIKFYKGQIKHAYSTLLVHLDDSNEGFQNVVQEILDEIGSVYPELLIEECKKIRLKHKSPERCDILIRAFEEKNKSDQ